MIIKFGEWETTTPENSEEVMKKQILYYQRHPEEYLELVYDNLHLFKYQKLLLKNVIKNREVNYEFRKRIIFT